MSKIYSENISKTNRLVKGLEVNIELVRDKGIDEKLINFLKNENLILADLNKEIEALRLELRTKTRQGNMKLFALKKQVKEAKKIVKSNFDKEKWKKFGITDKR